MPFAGFNAPRESVYTGLNMFWKKAILYYLFGIESADEADHLLQAKPGMENRRGKWLERSLLADLKHSESQDFLRELLDSISGQDTHLMPTRQWDYYAAYD